MKIIRDFAGTSKLKIKFHCYSKMARKLQHLIEVQFNGEIIQAIKSGLNLNRFDHFRAAENCEALKNGVHSAFCEFAIQ